MDYAFVSDDFLTGDLISRGTALPYDVIAMHVLYDGAPVDKETTPAMCNDDVEFRRLGDESGRGAERADFFKR